LPFLPPFFKVCVNIGNIIAKECIRSIENREKNIVIKFKIRGIPFYLIRASPYIKSKKIF